MDEKQLKIEEERILCRQEFLQSGKEDTPMNWHLWKKVWRKPDGNKGSSSTD